MRADTVNVATLRVAPNSTTSLRPYLATGPRGADGSNVVPTDTAMANGVNNTGGVYPLFSAALTASIDARVPAASTTVAGKSELATSAETIAGADVVRTVTPAGARALVDDVAEALGGVDVRRYGALGDEATNNDAAMAALMTAVVAARRTTTFSSLKQGSKVITLPPGDFKLTALKAFLGAAEPTTQSSGIVIRGAGQRITNIIYDHAGAGVLCFNNYWQGVVFEDLTFVCTAGAAGSTFLQSYTTNAAQDYTFHRVSWRGPWKYIADLQGTNNNSEWKFIGCATSGMQDDGAFLYSGTTSTSDQFLNYWFFGMKHLSTSAPLIDMSAGGNIHLFGIDASDWGVNLTAPGYLINLRQKTHSSGVCTATGRGIRVEGKNAFAGFLNCEWGQGAVEFSGVDWSSHTGTFTYGDIIKVVYGNAAGASITFRDSQLAGGINVKYADNDYQSAHRIVIEDCRWRQKLTPSEVVTYDETALTGSNFTKPIVEFIRCRGDNQQITASGTGAATWDATIGYTGETVYPLRKRVLSVRSQLGPPITTASPIYVHLPVGALITGLHAVCPAGQGSETSDGTWTLSTTEASPTTICSVTPAVMNAGYDVTGSPATPYYCNARDKASVKIVPTNILAGQSQRAALLLIEGYW